tara:strand:- start:84 stop:602 length:519 start_codon:yes stop_codon:yes gene_type:complete
MIIFLRLLLITVILNSYSAAAFSELKQEQPNATVKSNNTVTTKSTIKTNPQQRYLGSIDIVLTALPKKTGVLYIAIHTESSFLKETPPPYRTLKIDTFTELPMTITLDNVKEGNYAITSFYDQNDNQKLDFFFFVPSEPTAFSQNYSPMGPPQFKDCSFEVTQNVVVQTLKL